MQLIDYIQISAKHLYKRKLRTALTVSGISIGIVFFTMMISLLYGGKQKVDEVFDYSDTLRNVYVSPFIETEEGDERKLREVNEDIQSRNEGIGKAALEKLRDIDHVVAAEADINVAAKSIRLASSDTSYMASVVGVPISEHFTNEVLAGRDFDEDDTEAILLPSIYLDSMGVEDAHSIIGKKVILEVERNQPEFTDADQAELDRLRRSINPDNYATQSALEKAYEKIQDDFQEKFRLKDREAKDFEAEVIGVRLADKHHNQNQAFVTRSWARELLVWSNFDKTIKEEQLYFFVTVKADHEDNVPGIVEDVQDMGFGAYSIKKQYEEIDGTIKGMSIALGVLALLTLGIACIGVVNTMIMAIYERTREIGIMKATGATSRNTKGLFTIEAGVMGAMAGTIGLGLGYALAHLIQYIVEDQLFGDGGVVNNPLFKDGVVDIIELPVWLAIMIVAFGCLVGMIAGYFPARRAAKMDPAEALRYE